MLFFVYRNKLLNQKNQYIFQPGRKRHNLYKKTNELILCHLHKYEEKTGTHSAIKIRRFFCYFIFVIYFCTTRNRESCCFSSAVEHFLGKEEVPGSSPGNSSKKRGCLTNRRHPLYLFLFVLLSRNHFRICDSRKIKNLPAPLQPHAQCRRHS